MKYLVRYAFDVWGTDEEGWMVNDITTLGTVDLDINDNDDDNVVVDKILNALKPWFDKNRVLRENPRPAHECCGPDYYAVDLGESEKPWISLYRVDDESNDMSV